MKLCEQLCIGLLLGAVAAPLWSQADNPPTQPVAAYGTGSGTDNSDSRMLTPPPVSGQSYPTSGAAGERSNYLRAGVTFSTAYTDNALGTTGPSSGTTSAVSYSVWPTLSLDETTSRLHSTLSYAPGFTFYQNISGRNEADQTASINLQYRLSPHVTFSAMDGFQKSSNAFNQPNLASAGAVSGGVQGGNFSVIAPIANRLSNSGNVGVSYQFAVNSMIGASGMFTNLHYPDSAQVPGLFDTSSQGGSVFYSFRASKMHYIGVTYQYQRLLSQPAPGTNETQTQSVVLFYTLYPMPKLSISVFGGPQYSNVGPQFSETESTPSPAYRSWNSQMGGSLAWQGRLSNLAISYSHMISSGSGLVGAVKMDNASASLGQQLSRTLSATLTGSYTQNGVLATTALLNSYGHSISGTATVQQQLGQHVNLQLGYTRLHQDYSTVAVLAATPSTNREFVSISYQFSRPLGR